MTSLQGFSNLEVNDMASMTIRNLDDDIKKRLRIQAAEHGHSMEEEARAILRAALTRTGSPTNLARAIRARFAPLGRRGTGNTAARADARATPVRLRSGMILLDTNVVSELIAPNPIPV